MSPRKRSVPCAVPDCSSLLEPRSRTGVCRKHMHYVGACTCYQCTDPIGIAEHSARAAQLMRKINEGPARKVAAERLRKLNTDPARNPLIALSAEQRKLHRFYTRTKKLSSAESLALINGQITVEQAQGEMK